LINLGKKGVTMTAASPGMAELRPIIVDD